MKEIVKGYVALKAEFNRQVTEIERLTQPLVALAQFQYWDAERVIQKEFGRTYAVTMYDFVIRCSNYDSYNVMEAFDDHFTVCCESMDSGGEAHFWHLAVPYKEEDMPRFLEEFRVERTKVALRNKELWESTRESQERLEYERLKKKYGKEE